MTTTPATDWEIRSVADPPEFRAADGVLTAAGVAMRYDARSRPITGHGRPLFREMFRPGSLTKTIAEQDIRSHLEHHGGYLGRTSNGSLRLIDSATELRYELDLPDTTAGRDAAALLERRDLGGASLGFRALPGDATWSVDADDGLPLRTVSAARVSVVDLVTTPAYPSTSAALALRSLADERGMDLRSLLEAADRGELPALIASEPSEDDDTDDSEDDGRLDPTVVRPAMSASMY